MPVRETTQAPEVHMAARNKAMVGEIGKAASQSGMLTVVQGGMLQAVQSMATTGL